MQSANTRRDLWRAALRQRVVWSRAAAIGLPIGCIQAMINQGDIWWHHQADLLVLAKTVISPIVTFSVALISAAEMWIEKQKNP